MKKTMLTLAIGLVVVLMLACGGANSNDPKTVAKNFFEALNILDIDEAAKYATRESQSILALRKIGLSMVAINMDSLKREMANQKIEYSEPKIEGDAGTITIITDGKEKTDLKLKKEDGQWKVACDLNSLMQSDMDKMEEKGASPEEMKEAEEAIKMLNGDSLTNALQNAGEEMKEAGKTIDSLVKKAN